MHGTDAEGDPLEEEIGEGARQEDQVVEEDDEHDGKHEGVDIQEDQIEEDEAVKKTKHITKV